MLRRALTRRQVVAAVNGLAFLRRLEARPKLRVTELELIPIRATERTVWLIVRIGTDAGISGLGEASDAFGFLRTTKEDAARMEAELLAFFELIRGESPLEIESFLQRSRSRAASGLVSATAYSAIEQALWDITGQALDRPVYTLFGGKVRDVLPVYANINRATRPRTPEGFAQAASAAVKDGFESVKAAPFDGFPEPGSPSSGIAAAVDQGIAATMAMREAIGPSIALMIDCHGFFDVRLAVDVAERLEPANLTWYEEPVPPEKLDETAEIHRSIKQPMAAGETLFGAGGFAGLCNRRAVDVIMPDVKHCGGLFELWRIASPADVNGLAVAPHNPSGPISTAASAQTCAGMKNFRTLELQWGETPWRAELVDPPEQFKRGTYQLSNRSGIGVKLNEKVVGKYRL
jgi:galactonate dehydratase